jgi:DNA-binding GntR family transcriptional regulator
MQALTIERPRSLVDIVEERLRDAIVNAELPFGEPITEEGLGAAFGVSRTPLREALARLELQGLVVVVPKKGTFVFAPTVEDVEDLCQFRLMLELNALKLCLARDKAGTLRSMDAALLAMEKAHERADRLAYARADTAYHNAFFEHCGSRHMVDTYRTVLGRIAAIRTHLSVPLAQEQRRSFKEHKAVRKAFAAEDLPQLEKILDEHISRAKLAYAARASTSDAPTTQPPAGRALSRNRPSN